MINWLGVNGYPIDYIISCNPKPFSHVAPSIRPEQTIMMSAFLLNLPLNQTNQRLFFCKINF